MTKEYKLFYKKLVYRKLSTRISKNLESFGTANSAFC